MRTLEADWARNIGGWDSGYLIVKNILCGNPQLLAYCSCEVQSV